MALLTGTVSVRLEGDAQKAAALIPEGRSLLQKVQAVLANSQANTFAMSRRISEHAYIYALVANGGNFLHISVDAVEESVEEITRAHFSGAEALDFYSGMVFDGSLVSATETDENGVLRRFQVCSAFTPTQACRERFVELRVGRQDVERLTVDDWRGLGEDGFKYDTQYQLLRPSLYSGRMAKVVQLLLGYGRLTEGQVASTETYSTPEQVPQYLKDILANGVQVRYDYKFQRTHGIARGADDRLWLIEISITRGVLAMPLKYFPGTDTPEFYAAATIAQDDELLRVLDELGGLPTGESFPVETAEAIASGDIIRMLTAADMQAFYRCAAYSSSMGWTFNMTGTEAHNTGYLYEDTGLQTGYHYQLSFTIGPIRTERDPGEQIANAVARLVIQGRGPLWSNSSPSGKFIPFKAHEPLIGGLLSHDGSPSITHPAVACNTTIFVAFHEDNIKVARFFYDPTTLTHNVTDDSRDAECLYAGEWTITENTGNRSLTKAVYTNDIDPREALQDTVKRTNILSEDLGYDPAQYSDFLQNPEWCIVFRNRVFRETTTVEETQGPFVGVMLAVPENDRNAFYFAYGKGFDRRRRSTIVAHPKLIDPNKYYGYRRIFNAPQKPVPAHCRTDECGGRHTNRRVVCYNYEPYPCSEYADSGQWANLCDDVLSITSSPPRRIDSASSENLDAEIDAYLLYSTPTEQTPIRLPLTRDGLTKWLRPSPDPETLELHRIAAQHTALGEAATVYDTDLKNNGGVPATRGILPSSVRTGDTVTFIGVNGS